MRALIVGVVLVVASVAQAQPGNTEPQPDPQAYPPPPPQPTPHPSSYEGPPPPIYYAQPRPMQAQLTLDEQYLLEKGYISDGQYVGGGIASIFLAFGIGQAIQGRWSDRGWIFTVGEVASITAMMYGIFKMAECAYNCDTERAGTWAIGGALAMTGFRIWEIIDAWVVPPLHNRRVRELHMRLGMPVQAMPYIAPKTDGNGIVGGLSVRF